MKKHGVVIGVMVCAVAFAVGARADDARAADHAELVALREKFAGAMSAKDMAALGSCFAEKFMFTTIDQTTVKSRGEVEAHYKAMFTAPDAPLRDVKTTAEADERTQFLDADTGIVCGKGRDTYTLKNGSESVFDYRWTATVHREGGAWKVVAAHVGTSFLDNPYLNGIAGFWKKAAAGALAGGLLIGFLLGRRGRRTA